MQSRYQLSAVPEAVRLDIHLKESSDKGIDNPNHNFFTNAGIFLINIETQFISDKLTTITGQNLSPSVPHL
jgi:hypothetical protein